MKDEGRRTRDEVVHRGCRKGQIATMLTLFIGLFLTFAMWTANVGKVAMTRTSTSNAGDAGTLAAASFMASGGNVVNDINEQMKLAFSLWSLIHSVCGSAVPCIPYPNFGYGAVSQAAFIAAQAARVAQAAMAAQQAESAAEDVLRRFAYINGGIDDPIPKRFSDFLDAEQGDLPDEYVWTDRQWSAPAGGTKEVENTFEIVASDIIAPVPAPVPFIVQWGFCDGGATFPCGPWTCCLITFAGVIRAPAFRAIWPEPSSMVMDGNGKVNVTIRRIEPDADLRLWTMRYHDPNVSQDQGIISKSRASYGGGFTIPWPSPVDDEYDDVHLEAVGGGG